MEWKKNTRVVVKLDCNDRGWQSSSYPVIMINDYNLNHWLLKDTTLRIHGALNRVRPYQLYKHYRILVNLNDSTYKITLSKNKNNYLLCEWDLYNEPAIHQLRPNSFSISNLALTKKRQRILSEYNRNFDDKSIITYNEKDYSLRVSVEL